MKKKILLVNLPSDSVRKPEEHCGLGYLHAFLDEKDLEVDIYDAYALRTDIQHCKEYILKWINQGDEYSYYIGISAFVTSHESLVELGEYIKTLGDSTIFAGGHYATLNRKYLMNEYEWLDAIIVGEGEISTYELIMANEISSVPGVYIKNDSDFFIPRERVNDLDNLPFQTRYLSKEQLGGQPFTISTSRGCYGECSFCSIATFYQTNGKEIKQTYRSAKSVSDEIHMLVNKKGATVIKIVDDNFFRDKSDSFLEDLVDRIEKLKVNFRLSARPDDITEERAILLKKMGATVVGIGVESAHEESLKLFNKGIEISDSIKAIDLLNKNSITCLVNFIMFNPIIVIDGVDENCKFIKTNIDKSIFHRINSHLWIRSTDPIVDRLEVLGLCERKGFPYIECIYKNDEIMDLYNLFDKWCISNMKEYYAIADILMAKGIAGNEEEYKIYKQYLKEDVQVLEELINIYKNKNLKTDGEIYLNKILGALHIGDLP
jgi:hypothetical protein